jgi:Flp pilus assembly pilin Flp
MHWNQMSTGDVSAEPCGLAHPRTQARAPRQRGQSLVEYVLIILLVALAVVLALSLLAPTINSIFRAIPPAL